MKITKYGHACLFIENNGELLLIDPGGLTELPEYLSGIKAVIITHPHFDHLDINNLNKIIKANPDLRLYGVAETIEQCHDLSVEKFTVDMDTQISVIGLEIDLYHLDHAIIYKTSPCKNLAVKIEDELYYPGDSLQVISEKVRVIAVPISAPWVKAAEYIEFALRMKPEVVFPTHNGLLNDPGHKTMDNWLEKSVTEEGIKFVGLKNGESL